MEKVKLTPEQAEAIKTFCKTYNQQYWLEIFKNNKQIPDWEHEEMRVLTELSDEEFALAVCGWYEIEEPYKVGDWLHVTTPNFNFVAKVVDEYDEYTEFDNGKRLSSFEFRKATPEEIEAEKKRRKWAAIGREVDEYRKGDIVMVIEKIYAELFVEGSVKVSTLPDVVEFVDPQHGPYLRGLRRCVDVNEIELVCPIEHRFDLKEDE
jgi:hypothetical protein